MRTRSSRDRVNLDGMFFGAEIKFRRCWRLFCPKCRPCRIHRAWMLLELGEVGVRIVFKEDVRVKCHEKLGLLLQITAKSNRYNGSTQLWLVILLQEWPVLSDRTLLTHLSRAATRSVGLTTSAMGDRRTLTNSRMGSSFVKLISRILRRSIQPARAWILSCIKRPWVRCRGPWQIRSPVTKQTS